MVLPISWMHNVATEACTEDVTAVLKWRTGDTQQYETTISQLI